MTTEASAERRPEGTKRSVRADHVGSLLRPDSVKQARATTLGPGELSSAALADVENAAIIDAVAMQQEIGLPLVTDGEFRRSFWHYDFLDGLSGLDVVERPDETGVQFSGTTIRPFFPTITDRLDFPDDHPMLDHFRYLASVATATPKISIPGPSACHFRTDPADIAPAVYRDVEVLFADIAATYAKAVQAFYDAGCRHLQLDDIFFAYLGDETQRAIKREAGYDPDWLITAYADMLEQAIANRPVDMTIAMHLCRGNFQSTWVASGGYDPAADAIFNRTSVDVYLMEYDTDRAGGLEPLGLLPKGNKRVLPGFITTKTAELEPLDELKARFEEASRFVDLDQLGIAPQCGFASTEEGNLITADDQRAKLELVVACANDIWGGVEG
ncbi:MAG: 5-methyltetrahydropteroyltriglutamate--homocysteine S-methyltransferase [Acidimicrobiia bacterium]|nr:5-methyltetrahydropteroyltriglutamate--homocysteine S-methyltransferase [Acidimicrobiia bacterium]